MSDTSTKLQLPFLAAGQAQKHVTVNESLLRLDALVQCAVESKSTTAQPGSPSDGQIYILPAGKTGTNWGGMTDLALAYYRDGAWEQISPREGFVVYVKDADLFAHFDGANWIIDYESGTFTPTVTFATPGTFAPSYDYQYGRHRRIGNVCHYWLAVQFDANAYSGASGNFRINGLPFTCVADASLLFEPAAAPFLSAVTLNAADRYAVGFVLSNTARMEFYTVRSAAAVVAMGTANFPASTNDMALRVAGSYRIA